MTILPATPDAMTKPRLILPNEQRACLLGSNTTATKFAYFHHKYKKLPYLVILTTDQIKTKLMNKLNKKSIIRDDIFKFPDNAHCRNTDITWLIEL